MTEEPTLKLGPGSSHVASIGDPLVVWQDAMHKNTLLIPVFRTNFWVLDVLLVERVFYPQTHTFFYAELMLKQISEK